MQTCNRSIFMRLTVIAVAGVALAGCGSKATLKPAPVAVSGKVSQAGQPVSGVVMVFQPLDDGYMRELPLQKDGSFNGEFIAGRYAYYVTRPAVPGAAQPPRSLDAKYFHADLTRTVTVEPGTQLAIALD
jgi:hypothetical protein